ncbi:DUF4177 domain-containing protein [Ruegeria arenilitoris]|uniref:DUF4177 domain-containing protein n=1 Tax=Ruegeria arenilitoris TaxID=1173585 RepID=UPI00147E6B90|nr:DUF4177 domain-containing protein [Ruegeria arenilitoris]
MQRYEYKVVPAPQKGTKARGVKTPEGRFANSIETLLNQLGQEGWEYQRAELLPSEERAGLTSSSVNWRNVLVFRRALISLDTQVSEPVKNLESDMETDAAPTARLVPGPEETLQEPVPTAPAPISEEPHEPPLTLNASESEPQETSEDTQTKI